MVKFGYTKILDFLCIVEQDKNKGTKIMEKATLNSTQRGEMVRKVAKICGVSEDYVRKVRNGLRNNDYVTEILIEYQQGETNLIKALKELVPIEGVKKRN